MKFLIQLLVPFVFSHSLLAVTNLPRKFECTLLETTSTKMPKKLMISITPTLYFTCPSLKGLEFLVPREFDREISFTGYLNDVNGDLDEHVVFILPKRLINKGEPSIISLNFAYYRSDRTEGKYACKPRTN